MGRTRKLSDQQIFETVTLPWVVRRLKGDNGRVARADAR
jgi:hypothetical protein